MKIKKYIHIGCIIFVSFIMLHLPTAAQEESSESKIIFKAMQDALNENMNKLKLDKLKSPFYIDYRITNAKIISVESSLGGIIKSIEKPVNNADVNVMVGDYKQNNLNFYTENSIYGFYSGGSFYMPMPLSPDYNAIRRSLWISTDGAYKNAAELMETKLGSLSQQNIPAADLQLVDFAKIPTQSKIIESQTTQNFDKQRFEKLTQELSLIFKNYPHFTKSGVMVNVYHADVYYLNNEGVQYKQPFDIACLRAYAETNAEDGEPLMDYLNFYFTDSKQLPVADSLNTTINRMALLLNQLRTAPVINELYCGPVLFTGDAAGEVVSQCFIESPNALLAGRKPLGSNPAMLRYVPGENTLESLMGKKVISRDLSVTAKDGLKEYNSTPLIGNYEVDAQGVSVNAELSLIKDGVLQTVLNDRIPTTKVQTPNGHKRFFLSNENLSNTICSGVIELTSNNKSSNAKLKKQLIALGKEEDLEYVYIIKKIANPMSNVPGLSKYTGQSISSPIYAYKVSVKDGSETLVRMTKISGLSLKSFKRVVSVSDKQQVYNTMQHGTVRRSYSSYYADCNLRGTPCSFIVPEGILFQELEIEKDQNIVLKKEPIAANPLLSDDVK